MPRDSDFTLLVEVAQNGYIVRPAPNMSRDCAPIAEWQVFESFDALVEHLRSRLPIYPALALPVPASAKRR